VAGVIFDRERFRLDIFVNPRLLDVENGGGIVYLPAPEGGIALINSIGAVVSGQSGAGDSYYNIQNSLVAGDGERRLRADLTYASEFGFGAERLAFEWDRPELRYSAGALWAPGSEITGRRKLIGVGIETQIDTRLDKDELRGSPVVVYLDRRARVDVVRDGRVLHSAIYEGGNQQIDTSSLPDGSYEILLRIEESGSAAREERRFYTKSRRIPSLGRTDFYAYGGMLVTDLDRGSLDPSRHPYFQGGVSRRIGEDWAIGGSVEASDKGASVEVGTTLLTPLAQFRMAAVADLDGTYGGILQVASGGSSRLNFNFDLRHIEGDGPGPIPTLTAGESLASPFLGGFYGSYSQIGGVVSYSFANLRFLGTFFYRDDESQAARYSIGPLLEWDVLRKGGFTLTLRGDVTATERGEAGFAGIALRLLGGRSSLTALGGARATSMPDDAVGEGTVAAVSGAWSPTVAGGDLSLGAGLERQPNHLSALLSTDFRHPLGSLAGDVVRSDGPGEAVTQYSLGFQTSIAAGAGAARVAGRTTTESMIVAKVEGARPDDSFEVLVNGQLAGTIPGDEPLTLALPTYRAYDVRIRPTGAGLLPTTARRAASGSIRALSPSSSGPSRRSRSSSAASPAPTANRSPARRSSARGLGRDRR
jgi:Mat/Ecp fimbriae outer membrane usher protein